MKKNLMTKIMISSILSVGTFTVIPLLASCNETDLINRNDIYSQNSNLGDEKILPPIDLKNLPDDLSKIHVDQIGVDPYLDMTEIYNGRFDKQLNKSNFKTTAEWIKSFKNTSTRIHVKDEAFDKTKVDLSVETVWSKGVIGIKDWKDIQKRFKPYSANYIKPEIKNGLFNTSKSYYTLEDDWACMSAVQTNWILWWLKNNEDKIKQWLKQNPDNGIALNKKDVRNFVTYKNDWQSSIFLEVINNLPKRYVNTDVKLLKWFFVGDERLQSGGFFKNLFKDQKNKIKLETNFHLYQNYNDVKDYITWDMLQGNIGGLSVIYEEAKLAHIITLYGADFDDQKNLVAVWVSDSDTATRFTKDYKQYLDFPPQIQRKYLIEKNGGLYLANKQGDTGAVEKIYAYNSFKDDSSIWDKTNLKK